MEYSHFGYFLAVCVLVFGSLIGWSIRMLLLERKIIRRYNFLMNRIEETVGDDG